MPSSEADAAGGGITNTISKRQRRKLLASSTKHVTPQQPKLTSAEARAKAYLRVAGIHQSTKKVEDAGPATPTSEVRFGRLLGSTDQRKRHAVVGQLQSYLQARCRMESVGLSELELMKVWKGLWHTLYMADKAVVQDELSKQLAQLLWSVAGTEEEDEYAAQAYLNATGGWEGDDDDDEEEEDDEENQEEDDDGVTMHEVVNTLEDDDEYEEELVNEGSSDDEDVMNDEDEEDMEETEDDSFDDSLVPHCRGAHLASLFLKTFFSTIRREWGAMDKYRVDKFYTLIRYMMAQVYKYMALRHWNLGIIRLFNDTLFEQVLSLTPNGLRFHIIDITLEELSKANADAPMPLTEATFCDVLEPYFAMVQGMDDKVVQQRIVDNILHKFLVQYSVVGDTVDDAENQVFDQVHVGTIGDFIFHLGSDTTTRDDYRKILYTMHKEYQRRIKSTGRDLEIAHEHEDDCDDHNHDGDWKDHNHEDDSDDEAPQLLLLDANSDEEDQEPDEKEAKEEKVLQPPEPKTTKKKRKRNREKEEEVMVEEPHVQVNDEPASRPKMKKKKKSKKDGRDSIDNVKPTKDSKKDDLVVEEVVPKKDKTKDDRVHVGDAKPKKDLKKDDPVPVDDGDAKPKKKSKKDKRGYVEKGDIVIEEEIVISVADQKKAKKAAVKAQEDSAAYEKEASKPELKESKKSNKAKKEEERRRVSFGRINHSKSHKASMRDLKNASPKPLPITPDQSILRVKTPTSKDKSSKGKLGKRKKALDYF